MTHVERIIPIVKLDLRLMFNSSLCDYSTLVKSARAVPNTAAAGATGAPNNREKNNF